MYPHLVRQSRFTVAEAVS